MYKHFILPITIFVIVLCTSCGQNKRPLNEVRQEIFKQQITTMLDKWMGAVSKLDNGEALCYEDGPFGFNSFAYSKGYHEYCSSSSIGYGRPLYAEDWKIESTDLDERRKESKWILKVRTRSPDNIVRIEKWEITVYNILWNESPEAMLYDYMWKIKDAKILL